MSPTTIDQQWIDRLVDGELNESERLELLSRLDREPDAWKRCAVTFLEAQMWHSSFRAARDSRSLMTQQARSPVAGKRRLVPPVVVAAIAASLMTAFTLGWSLGGRQTPGVSSTEIADNQTAGSTASGIDHHQGASGLAKGAGEETSPSGDSPVVRHEPATGVTPSSNQVASAGSPARPGNTEAKGQGEKPLAKSGLALPVVREWERRGFQIEKQPQVVSMMTRDGRKLTMPVDAVRLRFIGDRVY